MSDEKQEEGCGADPRAGWSAEDLYCGGPLVIELSGADSAVRGVLDELEFFQQKLFEAMAVPRQFLSAGPRLSDSLFEQQAAMTISWSKLRDPLSWADPKPDIMAVTRDIARS